jgi:acetyl-CoA C-acetyltransferase
MTSVIGYYTTSFGELWSKSLFDLVEEAMFGVLNGARLEKDEIDAVFFGNMLSGVLENNLHSPSKIAEILKSNMPVFRAEAACASGGMAFHLALSYLQGNPGKTVMVVGAEKMTDYAPEEVVTALTAASSGEEQEAGITFPGLYALMAQSYLSQYKASRTDLAPVAVKNHYHGSLNDKAHFRRTITAEQVLKSAPVAHPLGVLDCSPISDGASAVLVTSSARMAKNRKTITVLGSTVATDTISLKNRRDLYSIQATEIAAKKAFRAAKLTPRDVSVAEVHDCFTIAEVLAMEDLGFYKKGQAIKRLASYETQLGSGSGLTVNTSGGLKAAGHPVGATGIKQIGEIYLQLTNQAGRRQVSHSSFGLTHNVGGSGGTAIVSLFGV